MTAAGTPPWPGTEPPRYERLKLAVAVTGLVFMTLFGWFLYSLLFQFLDFLFTLWGLLLLLGLIASGIVFAVALAFSWRRRRPPGPSASDMATAETLGTRQM